MQNQSDPSESYDDSAPKQSLTTHQSTATAAADTSNTSPQSTATESTNQTRKRKHGGDDDDGPPSRRTSFQRVSPSSNLSAAGGAGGGPQGAGFMPVNNSGAYANLSSPQHSLPPSSSLNGVSPVEHQISQIGSIMSGIGMPQQPMPGDHLDPSFGMLNPQDHIGQPQGAGPAPIPPRPGHPAPITKPQVGSEEWHRVRKDNHKEVERRRRETINEGINELAKIVPGCEKNKGSILQRTVQYINELKKELEKVNSDRGVEKMLTDQAMRDLGNANDKLKAECERAWREADTWKKVVSSAENNSSSNNTAGATTANNNNASASNQP
ncbi:basic helix-loop-helix protein [Orbilia ellipsospora]|uniref:Basic helix-loop-helix protein n=1 Tax=Orbilia ellipsospora TaxID=2528407 RepID=A0AAV9XKL0_9PEZI